MQATHAFHKPGPLSRRCYRCPDLFKHCALRRKKDRIEQRAISRARSRPSPTVKKEIDGKCRIKRWVMSKTAFRAMHGISRRQISSASTAADRRDERLRRQSWRHGFTSVESATKSAVRRPPLWRLDANVVSCPNDPKCRVVSGSGYGNDRSKAHDERSGPRIFALNGKNSVLAGIREQRLRTKCPARSPFVVETPKSSQARE